MKKKEAVQRRVIEKERRKEAKRRKVTKKERKKVRGRMMEIDYNLSGCCL